MLRRAFLGFALLASVSVSRHLPAEESRLVQPSQATLAALACDSSHRLSSWETLEGVDAEVGRIHFQIGDIFDTGVPSQNRRAYRTVNRLHRTTRAWVVEEQLLFASGDPLDRRVIEETERRLRSLRFLYDATIVPVCKVGGQVDLLVITRDVWTLGIKASFKREGGENTVQAGLSDDNLLGIGRPMSALYISDPDRDAYQLRYYDPSLLGPNREARVKFEQRSDGHRHTLELGQPFYSLDTRRALTTHLVTDQRAEKLYSSGEVVQEFDHKNHFAELRVGFSGGYRGGDIRRWSVGYTYQDDQFAALPESISAEIPESRTLSYPWMQVEWLEDGYIEARNVDRIGRTEDLNLGTRTGVRVGVSLAEFGGDRTRTIVESWFESGWVPTVDQIVLFDSGLEGRLGDAGSENVLASLGLRYYWRNLRQHQLYAALRLEAGWDLDGERQLLVGGDSGLRGYVRNIQDGDRRVVFNLEQRFYSGWEIMDLVNVGAAVFFDTGAAWYAADPQSPRFLHNVGVGLRLGSSRSAQGGMLHFDVAFPLSGESDEIQFLIRSRETF